MIQNVSLLPAADRVFKKASARDTALLLLVAWLVPFAVHQVPWSGETPLGAHLLPMFWAAFVAVYFYGLRIGVLVSIFMPGVNLIFTGLPVASFLKVLPFELAVFSLIAWFALQRWPVSWITAPLCYIGAKAVSTAVVALTPLFGDLGRPADFFVNSVATGLAGLVALAAINLFLVRTSPKPDDWDEA